MNSQSGVRVKKSGWFLYLKMLDIGCKNIYKLEKILTPTFLSVMTGPTKIAKQVSQRAVLKG